MLRLGLAALASCAILRVVAQGQAPSCPPEPTWRGAACGFNEAFGLGETPSVSARVRAARPYEENRVGGSIFPGYDRFVIAVDAGPAWEVVIAREVASGTSAVAAAMAQVVAALPSTVLRSLPMNILVVVAAGRVGASYGDRKHERTHRINLGELMLDPGTGEPYVAVEEYLLHELGHVYDHVHGISARDDWIAAVQADGLHVSEYAETNSLEDFAESFLAWASVRADEQRAERRLPPDRYARVRTHMPHRAAWFDSEALAAAVSDEGRLFHGLGFSDLPQ